MEYKTIEVKNDKLFKMLLEKKDVINAGRKLNKVIEPLQKKLKPLMEDLKELETKISVLESKMTPLNVKDVNGFKKDLGEFDDIVMFQAGKKGMVEYKTIDIVERAKEQFTEAKKKLEEKK